MRKNKFLQIGKSSLKGNGGFKDLFGYFSFLSGKNRKELPDNLISEYIAKYCAENNLTDKKDIFEKCFITVFNSLKEPFSTKFSNRLFIFFKLFFLRLFLFDFFAMILKFFKSDKQEKSGMDLSHNFEGKIIAREILKEYGTSFYSFDFTERSDIIANLIYNGINARNSSFEQNANRLQGKNGDNFKLNKSLIFNLQKYQTLKKIFNLFSLNSFKSGNFEPINDNSSDLSVTEENYPVFKHVNQYSYLTKNNFEQNNLSENRKNINFVKEVQNTKTFSDNIFNREFILSRTGENMSFETLYNLFSDRLCNELKYAAKNKTLKHKEYFKLFKY